MTWGQTDEDKVRELSEVGSISYWVIYSLSSRRIQCAELPKLPAGSSFHLISND